MANKKQDEPSKLEQELAELTGDLKRVQADFVNYRARMEEEKLRTVVNTKAATILKLLPVIDNIERAIAHVPPQLAEDPWAKGVGALSKNLEKSLVELGLHRIAALGQPFDPNLHEAISAEGEGENEVVSDELRAGYTLDGHVIRHSLVKVAHQPAAETESSEQAPKTIHETEAEKSTETTDDED